MKIGMAEEGFAQVSRWENDHQSPSSHTLAKIVEVCRVDGHWMLTGQGVPEITSDDARGVLETIRRMVR